ncbi:inactive tyrosine-protein kinase PEAK1 [Protopterus annectens]|uniref:inactive tyrosine-protein kinase PEAK1 n=1 Tax=Protopterus annectens TaxID=7888 RepID=UPI001CFA27EF|nr:inactive tyrosine-protein kinase PEAK1 [Protopterus annectens]XP_043933151.1 inactive tyrosine-protein kinase PEAK1 [Protopterus annectens]
MSACNTFTEHIWKPGECKNCFKPKSLHRLNPDSEKSLHPQTNIKTNANHSNNHRTKSTGSFKPPVAKKPTIAVKPTMMVVEGQSIGGDLSMSDHCENKQMLVGWNQNKVVVNRKPLNNNIEDDVGYSHIQRSCGISDGVNRMFSNNNNGLADVLKEVVGLDNTSQVSRSEGNSRDSFCERIHSCYKRSLERKIPPSCMIGGIKDSQNKHVVLSGSTVVISNEGGRFCYPEFSSGDDSGDDAFYGGMHEDHESWDESDEELLAMEIRMRGQPRFANFRANTLSPVRFCTDKKWNTVPLRNKSLQRICAVDYDDSYDEILNGYGEDTVIPYGQDSMQSMISSDSTSPESSLTDDSRSASISSQKLSNGVLSPIVAKEVKFVDRDSDMIIDAGQLIKNNCSPSKAASSSSKSSETHTAILALRLEEKDGRIAVQNERNVAESPTQLPAHTLTLNFVPLEDQAKPYRVVNLEQSSICKPYTVVDVSAAMTGESLDTQGDSCKAADKSSSPDTQFSPFSTSTPTTPTGHFNISWKNSNSVQYQEVWTSCTSPRQKMPKVELITEMSNSAVPIRKISYKSAPASPTTTSPSSKTIPVKSPNLSEIKFNSYNNAGMPLFPIIIHDEPEYAKSSKNAVKVPIVINPNAYDNLAIYKSFLGTSGEVSNKEKTTSIISHTYEEIGSAETKVTEGTAGKPVEQVQGVSSEHRLGSASQKDYEFSNTLNENQTSPQRSLESNHSSPSRSQHLNQGSLTGKEVPLDHLSSATNRENPTALLSQIVASIQPPKSPPESPQSSIKCGITEELYSLPPDANGTPDSPVHQNSLFTAQSSSGTDPLKHGGVGSSKVLKDTPTKQISIHSSKPSVSCTTSGSPRAEQAPPFPPPRSTSSPYHTSNLLQKHFSNRTKFSTPTRTTDAESVLCLESRRATDAKPKRWISFKSFFRRKKNEDEEEKDKEKGKLVGLDGTVIHMLPPPPVQRHQWFSETKSDSSEKPSIVFTYKQGLAQSELNFDQKKPAVTELESETLELEKDSKITEDKDQQKFPRTGDHINKTTASSPLKTEKNVSHLPNDASLEGKSPLVSVIQKSSPAKQETESNTATPLSAAEGMQTQEEGDEADCTEATFCSATYSNLGQSRANMIPPKQPRQVRGASEDAIAFGGIAEHEAEQDLQPTPPPLPKKTVIRANTEPCQKEFSQKQSDVKAKNNLTVGNPLYDVDVNWDAASACSSASSDAKIFDNESGDSLDRCIGSRRINHSVANSFSSLTTVSVKEKSSKSMESLSGKLIHHSRQGIQKPQRHAFYKDIENREEVMGKIQNLHSDSLKKLASKCEDYFMAGQKDQLRLGVDSWSDFRLTSDKPCCEAGDAVYYTASYAKDPLNNYAVKICKSKAKACQQQYYHSLAVRQSLPVHFNIQHDCGHFLADVPVRLLPWEDPFAPVTDEDDEEEEEDAAKIGKNNQSNSSRKNSSSSHRSVSKHRSRVVVITREVPYQTVGDFVRESVARHEQNPDLYERQVCLLLLQLCSGLEHLKPYHVTHCDLRLENLLLVHSRPRNQWSFEPVEPNYSSACPARLIASNFTQAKQKSHVVDPDVLKDQSRLAPEIITATQYKKCDEFQTGILIYEMLHLTNPFEVNPELKEKEYTTLDLPPIPQRSLYSPGLQQLASFLLNPNPSERILISDAKGILQCLLWGPREDLFQTLNMSSRHEQRGVILQNWLELKRTLLMIKFAEKSLDRECGISLEDWFCCQYFAFSTTEALDHIVKIIQQQ